MLAREQTQLSESAAEREREFSKVCACMGECVNVEKTPPFWLK